MAIGRRCETAGGRASARAFERALGGVAMGTWPGSRLRRVDRTAGSLVLGLFPDEIISRVLRGN